MYYVSQFNIVGYKYKVNTEIFNLSLNMHPNSIVLSLVYLKSLAERFLFDEEGTNDGGAVQDGAQPERDMNRVLVRKYDLLASI